MCTRLRVCWFAALMASAAPLWSQQQLCSSRPVAQGSDEDRLMTAVNATDNTQQQITALDTFAQTHPNSDYLPCVIEDLATISFRANDFDKSIEYAEKDLAAKYTDLTLYLTLMRAYAASSKVSDTVFDVINKVPAQVKAEHPAADLAKQAQDYAVWDFFHLLARITDPAKTISLIDAFVKAYPDQENSAQVNAAYFQAYEQQHNLAKAVEYGDKAIAADPTNVAILDSMAMIYGLYMSTPSPDKAAGYAQKALEAAQGLKKPDGVDEASFKTEQDNQMGLAHMILGYTALMKAQRTTKYAAIIADLQTASTQLEGNPALQGQDLYYLAFAYEKQVPPNHRAALEALTKGVTLSGPFQGQAQALLAKVKAAN